MQFVSEEMTMKNAIRICAAILLAIPLVAQQPQTSAPLYRVKIGRAHV